MFVFYHLFSLFVGIQKTRELSVTDAAVMNERHEITSGIMKNIVYISLSLSQLARCRIHGLVLEIL